MQIFSSCLDNCIWYFLHTTIKKTVCRKHFHEYLQVWCFKRWPIIWKVAFFVGTKISHWLIPSQPQIWPGSRIKGCWIALFRRWICRNIFGGWIVIVIPLQPLISHKSNIFGLAPSWMENWVINYFSSCFSIHIGVAIRIFQLFISTGPCIFSLKIPCRITLLQNDN